MSEQAEIHPASEAPSKSGWYECWAIDLTRPHWRCICGTAAMPLTDDTRCKCADIYAQEWTRVEPDGVLGPVHQTKADHTPSDGQESGGGKECAPGQCVLNAPGEVGMADPCREEGCTEARRVAAASVGQAAPDGVGGKEHG